MKNPKGRSQRLYFCSVVLTSITSSRQHRLGLACNFFFQDDQSTLCPDASPKPLSELAGGKNKWLPPLRSMTYISCSDWSNHWFHPLSRETRTVRQCRASAEQYVWAPPPMGRLYYFARPDRVPLRHEATTLVMRHTLITIAEIPFLQFNNVGWS